MKVIEYSRGRIEESTIVLLGYFDGMHIGHQKLLQKAREVAMQNAYKIAIMTFLGNKEKEVIYTYKERLYSFEKLGIDYCIVANFDTAFKNQTGREFIEHLTKICPLKAVVCGSDFTFGKGAVEGIEDLKKICFHFKLQTYIEKVYTNVDDLQTSSTASILPHIKSRENLPLKSDEKYSGLENISSQEKEKVSTTTIKKLLQEGAIQQVEQLLGSPYFILGEVVLGNQIGRTIDFPTANIKLDSHKVILKNGVYAVQVCYAGKQYKGIANLGRKPTVDGNQQLLEVHIFDFEKEIYGQEIVVYFLKFIREIKKFNGLQELKNQIKKDIKEI